MLAQESRQFLLEKISRTGGHLASNLGVVELTMALHLAFDLPKDKIIWDVGHQAYPHKILTGRRDGIHTVKQKDGVAPFPKREESEYDTFGVGHSSTSISAELGMAIALQRAGATSSPSPVASAMRFHSFQPSTILPSSTRTMAMPLSSRLRPVGGTPSPGPLWVSRAVQRPAASGPALRIAGGARERAQALGQLMAARPASLLLVCHAPSSPDRGTARFLREAAFQAGRSALLLVAAQGGAGAKAEPCRTGHGLAG